MQFNPQTHIRLTKHIWIKRVPKGQIVVAVLVSIVGIALLVYGFSSDRPSPPKTSPVTQTFNGASPVGTLAPDFTVSDKTHSYQLSKLRGIVVVVNFWASWAPACAEELPLLQQLLHDQPGPMVLAISADASQKQYDNFIRINHLALDTFREPNQATAKLFHSEKWPETYIIDRQGVVRRKLIGAQDWSSPELREFLKSL